MWVALEAVHGPKGHLTVVNIKHMLFYSKAEEGDNLVEHTNKLKTYWEQVNAFDILEYNISNVQFKSIITGSLPSSWDSFTAPYSNQYKNLGTNNEQKNIDSQTYIGLIQDKYHRRKAQDKAQTFVTYGNHHNPSSSTLPNNNKSLKDCIDNSPRCTHCNGCWHAADQCYFKGKGRCQTCQQFHRGKCQYETKELKGKRKRNNGRNEGKKRQKDEQAQRVIQQNSGEESGNEWLPKKDNPHSNE